MVSKLATFRTDDETWDSFQAKAKRNGTNASALLQRFVRDYLDDKLDSRIDSPAVSDVDIQAMIDDAIAAKLSEIKDEIKEEYGAGFRGISANITDLLQQRDHEIDELKTAIAALTSEATAPAKKLKIVA
jgi:SpoVK/Ycf46/Vps4 family AAA+-type ATPase